MDFTSHFRFLKLGQGDNLNALGYKFTGADRDLLDGVLFAVGAGHHHDGAAIGGTEAPTVSPAPVLSSEDGALPGGELLYYKTTVVRNGIESQPSPVGIILLDDALASPDQPTAARVSSGGGLDPGTYWYALTAYRGSSTLETTPSAAVIVNLPAQAGNDQIARIFLPDLPGGADGFNLYRRIPSSTSWQHLVTIAAPAPGDHYDDTGAVEADCERLAPYADTSSASNAVDIHVPDTVAPGDTWKVYRTFMSVDWDNTLIASELLSGTTIYTDRGATPQMGSPPNTDVVLHNPDPIDLATEVDGILDLDHVERGDEINTMLDAPAPPDSAAHPHTVERYYAGQVEIDTAAPWVCLYEHATVRDLLVVLGQASADGGVSLQVLLGLPFESATTTGTPVSFIASDDVTGTPTDTPTTDAIGAGVIADGLHRLFGPEGGIGPTMERGQALQFVVTGSEPDDLDMSVVLRLWVQDDASAVTFPP